MRITLALFITILSIQASAQIYIGKTNTSELENYESVLIEFEKNSNKGLLLPTVSRLPTNASPGTILLDGTNVNESKIKLKKKTSWVDLSTSNGNASSTKITNLSDEKISSKVILGDETSEADGILVLESTTKSMVLPVVTTTDNIVHPSPGMIVYVINEDVKKSMLAVFNGTEWSYWTDDTRSYSFN